MILTEEEKQSLIHNRVSRSLETWREVKGIAENGYWYAAANRMYYACYYMTTALLMKYGYAASTHAGVIRLFGLHFVNTGMVSKDKGVCIAVCLNYANPVIMMIGKWLKKKI